MEISAKKKRLKRIAIAIVAIIFTLVAAREMYLFFNPVSYVNFQQYAPSYLPSDQRITRQELAVWTSRGWFKPYSVGIELQLNQGAALISQYATEDFNYECDKSAQNCKLRHSPSGQSYIYEAYLDKEKLSFEKGGTQITILSKAGSATEEEWEKTIDSFKPTELTGLEVRRYTPGP